MTTRREVIALYCRASSRPSMAGPVRGGAGGNVARGRTFYRQAWRLVMIRMLLVLAVIALGADALLNNGGYTQAAWHQLQTIKLEPTKDAPPAQKPS